MTAADRSEATPGKGLDVTQVAFHSLRYQVSQDDRQCRHRETDSCIDFTLGEAGGKIQENRLKGSPSVVAGKKWYNFVLY